MDQKELSELMMSLMSNERTSYDNNLAKFGYADEKKPSEIDIYPINFDSKAEVVRVLDAYNETQRSEGADDKVITYTDLVGALMSSVTDIVNMVSLGRIAFVSISLVVSSIMIGIITYISVLERKKEIGILRAMGASKLNVANVFNAETIIEGLIAGVFAILTVVVLSVPVNAIVLETQGVADIMILPWTSGLALIGVSVLLTFLGGLLPSTRASKNDPVEALRSE
jgi:ABC-type antimicrobial peptide transport system permease subunit